MKLRYYATLLVVAYLCSANGAAEHKEQLDWDPAHTWIFAVGVLHWKHSEMFGSFPVKERRDAELVDFFRQHGVPEKQIVYLQDEHGTQQKIDNAFTEQLKKIGPGDSLIVYYAGHGSKWRKCLSCFLRCRRQRRAGLVGQFNSENDRREFFLSPCPLVHRLLLFRTS